MPTPTKVILALGANLGEREHTLALAIAEVAGVPGVSMLWVSPYTESIALTLEGIDQSAPKYLNCVMAVTTTLEPELLLDELQKIESRHGRVRELRWASRTLDIDIVQFGDLKQGTERLTLPHPEAANRNFVLTPWSLAEPEAELLGRGRIRDLPNCNYENLSVLP
jgi:2-amino-4-hydroxy-6-hydroxymethyldihydropteridine diphosphokinase